MVRHANVGLLSVGVHKELLDSPVGISKNGYLPFYLGVFVNSLVGC